MLPATGPRAASAAASGVAGAGRLSAARTSSSAVSRTDRCLWRTSHRHSRSPSETASVEAASSAGFSPTGVRLRVKRASRFGSTVTRWAAEGWWPVPMARSV